MAVPSGFVLDRTGRWAIEGGVERTRGSTAIGSTRRGTVVRAVKCRFSRTPTKHSPHRRTIELIDCSGDAVVVVFGNAHSAEIRLQASGRREVTRGGRIERTIRVVHVLHVHARGTAVVGGATLDETNIARGSFQRRTGEGLDLVVREHAVFVRRLLQPEAVGQVFVIRLVGGDTRIGSEDPASRQMAVIAPLASSVTVQSVPPLHL